MTYEFPVSLSGSGHSMSTAIIWVGYPAGLSLKRPSVLVMEFFYRHTWNMSDTKIMNVIEVPGSV